MAALDPITDFQDDGGTPAWRARQTLYAVPQPRRSWLAKLAAASLALVLLDVAILAIIFAAAVIYAIVTA